MYLQRILICIKSNDPTFSFDVAEEKKDIAIHGEVKYRRILV